MDLIQTLLDGLMVGGLYATVAIGVTLVFGIMGILNFAHGQMVMLGAYTAFFVVSAGFGFWPALAIGMVAMGVLGFVLERAVFRFTLTGSLQIAGLTLSSQRMLVLLLVVVLVVGCYLFLQKTRIGKAIRAMGQNRTGAALVGIQTSQVTAVVFVLGSAMAGAAGVLY